MTPRHQPFDLVQGGEHVEPHADQVLGDFSFGKKHLEELMLEDGLQILELECGLTPVALWAPSVSPPLTHHTM